ncbi:MAG: DJ-1 family glyoxalase III [Fibrobacteria bacterium]
MKRVLLILSAGFEELEAVAPIDLLRRAGIEVVTASTGPELPVTGGRGIRIQADRLLDDCREEPFDMVIVPGGPGVPALRKDRRVLDLLWSAHQGGVPIAAICAGPLVLADAGLLCGRTVTSFPGSKAELVGRVKAYSEDRVVEDGPIITSRGAGTSEEFALRLIVRLLGFPAAEAVRSSIVAR